MTSGPGAGAPSVGRLDWRPADTRSDLLAPPVAEALDLWAIPAWVARIDPELSDTAAFCAAYEVPLDMAANCVVVAGRRAENAVMAACLVLATGRADVNRTVRRHLDVRKISFAPMDEAVTRTGMAYGGITPIGLPDGWPVLVDERVAECPWALVGSGIRGSKLHVGGASLAALPGATTLALSVPA